jgi:hypothetical protein
MSAISAAYYIGEAGSAIGHTRRRLFSKETKKTPNEINQSSKQEERRIIILERSLLSSFRLFDCGEPVPAITTTEYFSDSTKN